MNERTEGGERRGAGRRIYMGEYYDSEERRIQGGAGRRVEQRESACMLNLDRKIQMNMNRLRTPEEPEGATCRGLWRSCTASGRQIGEDHAVRDGRL